MKPCKKCEYSDWKFEKVDGWINATCKQCGNTFSFEAKKKKKPVKDGGACRRCGSPVKLRASRITAKKKKKPYYFTATLHCTNPKCRTLYLSEEHKVLNHEAMEKNIAASLELGKNA